MKKTSLVICLVLAFGSSVNCINYGTLVDYPSIKRYYPFIARLNLDGTRCGGALIADRFVATAKHCLVRCPCYSNGADDWTTCPQCFVKLRENSDTNVDVETVYSIKRGHFLQDDKADLAIIELAKSANTCTDEEEKKNLCWNVTPVGLPDPTLDIPDLATVRTLGWGATEDSVYSDAHQSEFLRRLDVTINSTSDPLLIMTNVGFNNADPCGGDTGGPLLFGRPRTLVATGRGGGYDCETNNRTDGISDWNKVAVHLPWIRSIIGNMPEISNLPKPTTPTTFSVTTARITSNGLKSFKDSCGRKPLKGVTYAVSRPGKGTAPWAVSIGKYIGDTFDHFCTGSILAPGIVLSAAHCITSEYFDRDFFKVRAGVQNLKNTFAVERKIKKCVFHSEWQKISDRSIYFDVALFFLKTPFTFSALLQPICLPTQTYPKMPERFLGDGLTTVGWGRDNDDRIGEKLTQIDVSIRTNHECNFKYNQTDRRDLIRLKHALPKQLISSQFCADNNANAGIGTCNGDSGGSSFVRSFENEQEKFTIFGVTSGGIACGKGWPDFYTFVAHEQILPWIHSTADADEQKLSEFYHLDDNSVYVYCVVGSECRSGLCDEGLCIPPLSSSSHNVKPSSKCTDEKKPCLADNKCQAPSCNRYGDACWCPN